VSTPVAAGVEDVPMSRRLTLASLLILGLVGCGLGDLKFDLGAGGAGGAGTGGAPTTSSSSSSSASSGATSSSSSSTSASSTTSTSSSTSASSTTSTSSSTSASSTTSTSSSTSASSTTSSSSGCTSSTQCLSKICAGGVCQQASCTDGVRNHNEADVDCGVDANCGFCGVGAACSGSVDCEGGTGSCQNDVCVAAAHCANTVKDGTETDVNCGGFGCLPCATGKGCMVDRDCQSGYCKAGVCTATSCTNGMKDGNETATDCGGACPKCASGKACNYGRDCQSAACVGGVCL
jgi:hypothetical protein